MLRDRGIYCRPQVALYGRKANAKDMPLSTYFCIRVAVSFSLGISWLLLIYHSVNYYKWPSIGYRIGQQASLLPPLFGPARLSVRLSKISGASQSIARWQKHMASCCLFVRILAPGREVYMCVSSVCTNMRAPRSRE